MMRAESTVARAEALTGGLLDDAAVFPPGCAELVDAVRAHAAHRVSWCAAMIGPLVLPSTAVESYAAMKSEAQITVTFRGSEALGPSLAAADERGVAITGVEVTLGDDESAPHAVDRIARWVAGRDRALDVSVEVPRDDRASEVLAAIADAGFRAKLRLGGVRADMYPGELELAGWVRAVADRGIPFKATAGLHHAVRNSDPQTGFEQHGFLNVLLAASGAADGARESDLVAILSERDPDAVSTLVSELGERGILRARGVFRSFGTCSVDEPIAGLVALGLVPGPRGGNDQKDDS